MTVERLESQPKAQEVASAKLASARQALLSAEAALENGDSLEQVRHDSYVARRQAEIGIELTLEAEAIEEQQQAEDYRNELRLRARTIEAERAQSLAEQRASEARESAREAERSRAIAEAALTEASQLAEELEEMEARQTERGLVLTLSDVLFDTGQAELKDGARVAMDRLAAFMNENAERNVMIEGHTDSRGSEQLNADLSARRAAEVASALAERGIAAERLRTVGLGEAYPVASNDTAAGMQQNRRVEIVISDRDGSFPDAAERRMLSPP
jgi:outer membrane protein OmpA-like peptidoglycan-associated protein